MAKNSSKKQGRLLCAQVFWNILECSRIFPLEIIFSGTVIAVHYHQCNLCVCLAHSERRPQIFIPKRKSTSIVSSIPVEYLWYLTSVDVSSIVGLLGAHELERYSVRKKGSEK